MRASRRRRRASPACCATPRAGVRQPGRGDVAPVGILLCSDKDGAEVEFATAGMDQKLFVSRYLTALPSVAKLRAFLEADRERIESLMPAAPGATQLVKHKPVSQSARRKT